MLIASTTASAASTALAADAPARAGIRSLVLAVMALVVISGCDDGASFDSIHLPGTEPAAGEHLQFHSAIKVRSGDIVFLSGITAAPVPHSHPHVPAEFDHLDFSAEAQTEAIMERLKQTLEAAGG